MHLGSVGTMELTGEGEAPTEDHGTLEHPIGGRETAKGCQWADGSVWLGAVLATVQGWEQLADRGVCCRRKVAERWC